MKLIDLSYYIENRMPVHPYDKAPILFQDKFLTKEKFNSFWIEIGSHAGTHIDSPMHLTNSTNYICDYSLEKFCGKACVLDVRGKDVIKYEDGFKYTVNNNDVVLLYTGYEEKYGKEEYYTTHPVIDFSMAEFLVEKKVKLIGMDIPSPDRYPFTIHKYLFANEILIIENLCNLGLLINEKNIEIFAFPLKIKADASLVRVVARTDF